jgi:hypothetical protein
MNVEKKSRKSLSPSNNLFSKNKGNKKSNELRIASPIREKTLNLSEEFLPDLTSRNPSPSFSEGGGNGDYKSPKHKKTSEDKVSFESVLEDYFYDPISLTWEKKGYVEYIICTDPISNIVYIDIEGEDDNVVSTTQSNSIEYTSVIESEVFENNNVMEYSVYENFKSIVKADVYGLVIHANNYLIFIKQTDLGEHSIQFKKLKEQKNKRFHVYPIVKFSDVIAEGIFDDNDEELNFLDTVHNTRETIEIINDKMKNNVIENYSGFVDVLNSLLEKTKKIKKDYENEYKNTFIALKDKEDRCFHLCNKYLEEEEGLDEDEVEDYQKNKLESSKMKIKLNHKNSTFFKIKKLIPKITKINEDLTEICKFINKK